MKKEWNTQTWTSLDRLAIFSLAVIVAAVFSGYVSSGTH